jgi:hypothetical protein
MRITHGFRPLGTPHAVTIGNFDGLHLGHQAMLARLQDVARARGLPSCVLSFEPHPREFFAPEQAPARLSSLREKAEHLQRMGIDRLHVFRFDRAFSALTAEAFIEQVLGTTLEARYVLVGDDFRYGAKRAGDFALLRAAGAKLGFDAEHLPTVEVAGERVSSTAVATPCLTTRTPSTCPTPRSRCAATSPSASPAGSSSWQEKQALRSDPQGQRRPAEVHPARRPALRQRRHPHRPCGEQDPQGHHRQGEDALRLRCALRAGLGLPRPADRTAGREDARQGHRRRRSSANCAAPTPPSRSSGRRPISSASACWATGTIPT